MSRAKTQATGGTTAPAICLVGATGSGKSTQVEELITAGMVYKVACYDSGSTSVYEYVDRDKVSFPPISTPLSDLIAQHDPALGILVIDNWPGYERTSVAEFKAMANIGKMTLANWGEIVPAWYDNMVRLCAMRNVILLANIANSPKEVKTPEGTVIIPAGGLVCTPKLRKLEPFTAMFGVVLGLSGGSEKYPRSWITPYRGYIGEAGIKYRSNTRSMMLPGQERPDDKLVPVDMTTFSSIVLSLHR